MSMSGLGCRVSGAEARDQGVAWGVIDIIDGGRDRCMLCVQRSNFNISMADVSLAT